MEKSIGKIAKITRRFIKADHVRIIVEIEGKRLH